jgi:hypothetical protein
MTSSYKKRAHSGHKIRGESRGRSGVHIFLTSTIVGGEWPDSCSGRFTPDEITPCTSWIGCVDPRAVLNDMEKQKFFTTPRLELRPLGCPASIIIIFFYLTIRGWSPYWVHSALRPLLAYCTWPGWLWGSRSWWNERFWLRKAKYSEKTCPDATLSTTNPTCQTRARTRPPRWEASD